MSKDSPQKQRKDSRPFNRLSSDNRMSDFVKNDEENYQTPTLNHALSFGERDRDREKDR